jgi:hypothetical protein
MSVISEKNGERSVLRQILQRKDVMKKKYIKAGVTEKKHDKII